MRYERLAKLLAVVVLVSASTVCAQQTGGTTTFQSGYDVGAYCGTLYGNYSNFQACCSGGCAGLHPGDPTGYDACMGKCMSLAPAVPPESGPSGG
jgi:hypothetical protein